MIPLKAATFILEGKDGEFSCQGLDIEITKVASETHIAIETKFNRISGVLLEAFVDELGDLTMIFPESDIRLPIAEASA